MRRRRRRLFSRTDDGRIMLSVVCAINNSGKMKLAVVNWPSCLFPLGQNDFSCEMCSGFIPCKSSSFS